MIELRPRSARRNGIQPKKWILINLIFPLLRVISRDERKKLKCEHGAKKSRRSLRNHPQKVVEKKSQRVALFLHVFRNFLKIISLLFYNFSKAPTEKSEIFLEF